MKGSDETITQKTVPAMRMGENVMEVLPNIRPMYLGCFQDQRGDGEFDDATLINQQDMDVEKCAKHCMEEKFTVAGLKV